MSIATKTGDDGTTSLLYGRRVPKTHPRVQACGAVDELNAALGLARASVATAAAVAAPFVSAPILEIQKELVSLMGELALDEADRPRYPHALISAASVDRLTALVDDLEKNHGLNFNHWVTPGDTPAAAAFDFARTVCRRAERDILSLSSHVAVNPQILRYLNRLSDLCWLYARYCEANSG